MNQNSNDLQSSFGNGSIPAPNDAAPSDASAADALPTPDSAASNLPPVTSPVQDPLQSPVQNAIADIPGLASGATASADSSTGGQPGSQPPTGQASQHSPQIAEDVDLIEKEWVIKAKAIIDSTRQDPNQQSKELSRFKADYLKTRYSKDLKVDS